MTVYLRAKHGKPKDQTIRVWSILLIKHDLHGELHDGIDDIIGIVLEGFDGLGLGDVGLGHDQLNVLLLHARGINLREMMLKKMQDCEIVEIHLLALLFLLSNSSRHTCSLGSGAWHLGSFESIGGLAKYILIQVFSV